MKSHSQQESGESKGLKLGGNLRMTRQRREVYDVLMDVRDHPTAAEVFDRTKQRMPHISLATVYNCLETLTEAGLVKQVNTDRGSARYCPNLREHAHFVCGECGGVFDVDPDQSWALSHQGVSTRKNPKGFRKAGTFQRART